ncbi:MAG: tRNA-dihydrouridine synthase family protein [Acidobacteria bacterium]|nr:tRNA-dihydrouridine synthase family protein [Acidobacteriota bacterium]
MNPNGFKIGNIQINPPLVLAPMAGISHLPFRRLIRKYGAPGLFFTEMLSARALPGEQFDWPGFVQCDEEEHPISYQIFASDPRDAEAATQKLCQGPVDIVDLNLSCPAPEIAKKRKAGAHLLNDLDMISRILRAMKSVSTVPVTAKIRLGKTADRGFLAELAAVFTENEVAAVTIHPRVTGEKLKRVSRWEYIGYMKEMMTVPVIGNGDVKTREDCLRMFSETGCDGVMIGRAAVQKPWIFSTINREGADITPEFLQKCYLEAVRLVSDYFEEPRFLGRIKEFTWYFSKNMKFGHHFASLIQNADSLTEVKGIVENKFQGSC